MSRRLFVPYRICPIGAHIDHQGGAVLGRTLNLGTTLEYEPLASLEIHLTSDQFGAARFTIGDPVDNAHWARYAQAAARVMGDQLHLGLQVHVDGPLAGWGLSSSASVGLAYLLALADVNGIRLSGDELVHLDFQLENGQLGLQNGILDPLTIVYGKKDALLYMDTLHAAVTPIPDPPQLDAAWIVAYSGVSRELTKSGFNQRVDECRAAAELLQPGARILSDVPEDNFHAHQDSLPGPLLRRARHYFTEVQRVHQGAAAWRTVDLTRFGALMNQSCASSIHNYESGSPLLVELQEIASRTPGVYGSRFSGGGYGGCVVILAQRDQAHAAAYAIAAAYQARHPDLPAHAFVAETGTGLR